MSTTKRYLSDLGVPLDSNLATCDDSDDSSDDDDSNDGSDDDDPDNGPYDDDSDNGSDAHNSATYVLCRRKTPCANLPMPS